MIPEEWEARKRNNQTSHDQIMTNTLKYECPNEFKIDLKNIEILQKADTQIDMN